MVDREIQPQYGSREEIHPAHYDTIVIGAGMSGLACASRLYQNARYREPNSLLVLEGRERIGGRINSVYVDECRLDTGANWIHGVGTSDKPNPLMALLPHKRYKELSGMVMFQPNSQDDIYSREMLIVSTMTG